MYKKGDFVYLTPKCDMFLKNALAFSSPYGHWRTKLCLLGLRQGRLSAAGVAVGGRLCLGSLGESESEDRIC